MPLLSVLLVVIVCGGLLWFINNHTRLKGKTKRIINIVVVIFVAIFLLKVFGILDFLQSVTV
jgi:preprotein translocase subunit SecE